MSAMASAAFQLHRELWPTIVAAAVALSWLIAVTLMLAHKRPGDSQHETRRDRKSVLGIVIQGIGFAIIWSLWRKPFTPIVPLALPLELLIDIATIALAIGSIWLAISAVRTLGKEWSFAARLVEGHRLVQHGPYAIVRNPIYAGMFGMMLATGLALTHWIGLLIATPVFVAGTMIRVRTEEKLLREAFGAEFEKYARCV